MKNNRKKNIFEKKLGRGEGEDDARRGFLSFPSGVRLRGRTSTQPVERDR
jgi:hypothetical protein